MTDKSRKVLVLIFKYTFLSHNKIITNILDTFNYSGFLQNDIGFWFNLRLKFISVSLLGSEFSVGMNSCSRFRPLLCPSFSRFLDAPRRRPGNVAPWDRRVIVINEAKMEPWRHNAVAPSENSYLLVSELRRLRGVIPWHYAMRREYPSFCHQWTGRNKPPRVEVCVGKINESKTW